MQVPVNDLTFCIFSRAQTLLKLSKQICYCYEFFQVHSASHICNKHQRSGINQAAAFRDDVLPDDYRSYRHQHTSWRRRRFTVWTDQPEHVTKAIYGMNRSTRACHQSDSWYEQINQSMYEPINQSMSPKRFTVWTDQPEHVTKAIHGMNRSTRACHQSDSRYEQINQSMYEQINQSMSPKRFTVCTDQPEHVTKVIHGMNRSTRACHQSDSRYEQINQSMYERTDQPEHVTKAIHGMNRSTRACHQSDSRYEQINQSMSPKWFTVWTDEPEHVTKAIHGMDRSTIACHQSDSRYEQMNQSMSPKRFTVWTDQPEHVTKADPGRDGRAD